MNQEVLYIKQVHENLILMNFASLVKYRDPILFVKKLMPHVKEIQYWCSLPILHDNLPHQSNVDYATVRYINTNDPQLEEIENQKIEKPTLAIIEFPDYELECFVKKHENLGKRYALQSSTAVP